MSKSQNKALKRYGQYATIHVNLKYPKEFCVLFVVNIWE